MYTIDNELSKYLYMVYNAMDFRCMYSNLSNKNEFVL